MQRGPALLVLVFLLGACQDPEEEHARQVWDDLARQFQEHAAWQQKQIERARENPPPPVDNDTLLRLLLLEQLGPHTFSCTPSGLSRRFDCDSE
jgi:hypothetical protein